MEPLLKFLKDFSLKPIPILDDSIPIQRYVPISLAVDNPELLTFDSTDPIACEAHINYFLEQNNASVAYGGYLEKRDLYKDKANFSGTGEEQRNIHLGMDFWAPAGTRVMVPISGKVHSFNNNSAKDDYGPTIILTHEVEGIQFHTLYGHLSLESLDNLSVGKKFHEGEFLATLGTSDINVNYAPHLHFQIIQNIGEYEGDYPGVCAIRNMEYYSKNCPDPNLLLKI
ncbi:MAG: peptidoglycan DD-metalloendopeptidase family protein [Saonia sp.]